MEAQARWTPTRRQTRIAGLCYLVVIGGVFSESVRTSLIKTGDPAGTASAIAESETLWRLGMTYHLAYLPAAAVVAVVLYGLFKPVHATLARLALFFSLSDVTIEVIILLHLYVPVAILREGDALTALDEGQRAALGYLSVRLFATGWSLALFIFSGFCLLTGVLILRSGLVPRVLGVLMVGAGVCYIINSMAWIHSPDLSDAIVPWILLPCFAGELSLALWLVIKGVRTDRVREVVGQ